MHAARDMLGVDVCSPDSDQETAPRCPHGPMLLFERFYKDDRASQKFYACSACRDRKNCSFFQWENEKVSEVRSNTHREIITASRLPYLQACERWEKMQASAGQLDGDLVLCQTCSTLLLPAELKNHHNHKLEKLQGEDRCRPSHFLEPVEHQKTQAQYLFSVKTTQFFIDTIRRLKFDKVLCVGTPRIHEEILVSNKSNGGHKHELKSLMLDIDYRYAQFFPPSQFCWYNMFNHFFFDNRESEQVLRDFLQQAAGEQLILIMDPPFGGLVEVLAVTLKRIWATWKEVNQGVCDKDMSTLWIFPYFMESHITSALPSFTMQDYKVEYENHAHFRNKSASGNKRGSPVRIFTNIPPADLVLPTGEGYRLCKLCQRFVSSENVHCTECNGCMSKDGRRYVHCGKCGTCVKPGRQHCEKCKRCEPAQHDCSKSRGSGCHICGELGHKRRDCPQRKATRQTERKQSRKNAGKNKGPPGGSKRTTLSKRKIQASPSTKNKRRKK